MNRRVLVGVALVLVALLAAAAIGTSAYRAGVIRGLADAGKRPAAVGAEDEWLRRGRSGGAVDAARGWWGHARRSVAHGDEGGRARSVAAAAVPLAAIRSRHHRGALAALALPPVFDDDDHRVAGDAALHQLAKLPVVAGRDDHDPRNHVPLLPEGIARMGRLL
jgi:hypothetical protein